MRKGFTLVELSIVLVIIGLLIGGILVAQSMISTAKLQSFIRQIGQFDAAVTNFKTKYNGLPGDTSSMGCTVVTSNACDNGLITDGMGGAADRVDGEIGSFWVSLQLNGFDQNDPTFSAVSASNSGVLIKNTGTGRNFPQAIIGSKTSSIFPFSDTASGGALRNLPFYEVADLSAFAQSDDTDDNPFTGAITPKDAFAIDQKIDDGNPSTGMVLVAEGDSIGGSVSFSSNNCFGASSSVYHLTSSAYECLLKIEMLSQTGQQP